MDTDDEIEKLKRRLYRKGETFKEREIRSPLTSRPSEAKPYWKAPLEEEARLPLPEDSKPSFSKKLFIVLGVVFVLGAIGVSTYFLLGGPNIISSKNIGIKVEGPVSLKGGEAGNWQVQITNKNKTSLELADLIIEYPENSQPIMANTNSSRPLYERRSIGKIDPGQTIPQTIQAYIFGGKDSDQTFKFTLEYRPEGSNAILAETKNYIVRLLQSPIEISLKASKEANAGEPITIEAEIFSNAETDINDLNFKMDYPSGFTYQDSDPKPVAGDNIWRLGTIEKNKKRAIKITGTLEGQDLAELAFRASAGPLNDKGEVVAYGVSVQTIVLKKPFLQISAIVGSRAGSDIASKGENLNVDIQWKNTLPEKIYNAVIEAKINGAAVSEKSISVSNGFYRSFDSTLVWNSSSLSDLSSLEPMAEAKTGFRFSIADPIPDEVIKQGNPTITIEIEMKAERITADQGKVEVANHFSKEIKIATDFQLSRRILYHSGPFQNSGPLPPKVGKETTYTIIWSLSNSVNAVSDANVSAFLPSYVRWLGIIKPENTSVSYDQKTGEIDWHPGNISAGVGFLGQPAQELAFQISFLPNSTQTGSQPTLVSEATLTGKDTFTAAFLRDVKSAATTFLDTDPEFKYNESSVAQ